MEKFIMLKAYEKKFPLLLGILILFLVETLFFVHFTMTKVFTYEKFQGVVRKNQVISLIIRQKELNLFYKNHYIYVDNKKKKFTVQQVVRDVLKRKGENYHEVLISFSFDKKLKENDVLEFSIQKDKIRVIEIFKIIWKGVFDARINR